MSQRDLSQQFNLGAYLRLPLPLREQQQQTAGSTPTCQVEAISALSLPGAPLCQHTPMLRIRVRNLPAQYGSTRMKRDATTMDLIRNGAVSSSFGTMQTPRVRVQIRCAASAVEERERVRIIGHGCFRAYILHVPRTLNGPTPTLLANAIQASLVPIMVCAHHAHLEPSRTWWAVRYARRAAYTRTLWLALPDACAIQAITQTKTAVNVRGVPQTHIALEDLRSHPVEVILTLLQAVPRFRTAHAMLATMARTVKLAQDALQTHIALEDLR